MEYDNNDNNIQFLETHNTIKIESIRVKVNIELRL